MVDYSVLNLPFIEKSFHERKILLPKRHDELMSLQDIEIKFWNSKNLYRWVWLIEVSTRRYHQNEYNECLPNSKKNIILLSQIFTVRMPRVFSVITLFKKKIICLSLHYLHVFARVFAIVRKSVDTELESNNFNYSDIFSLETRLSK